MKKYKANALVKKLLKKGYQIPCDNDMSSLDSVGTPNWYDEIKFKRGQKLFHDHTFAMFFAKLCGLITILAIPSILNILKFTNNSDTPLKAYRRYMNTVLHMMLWYDEDFKPGSRSWNSLKHIRKTHFRISQNALKDHLNHISQADMVLTQFGFIGFIILFPCKVGIYNISEEELEGLIHLWRVIGYSLGIKNSFNLCRRNLPETQSYCKEIFRQIIRPQFKEADSNNFLEMSFALVEGISLLQMNLRYKPMMYRLHEIMNISTDKIVENLSFFDHFICHAMKHVFDMCRYKYIRIIFNVFQRLALNYGTKYIIPYFIWLKFGIESIAIKITTF